MSWEQNRVAGQEEALFQFSNSLNVNLFLVTFNPSDATAYLVLAKNQLKLRGMKMSQYMPLLQVPKWARCQKKFLWFTQ